MLYQNSKLGKTLRAARSQTCATVCKDSKPWQPCLPEALLAAALADLPRKVCESGRQHPPAGPSHGEEGGGAAAAGRPGGDLGSQRAGPEATPKSLRPFSLTG